MIGLPKKSFIFLVVVSLALITGIIAKFIFFANITMLSEIDQKRRILKSNIFCK